MTDIQFDRQLPGTLDLLVRTLRNGYSVVQSFQIVIDNAPEPTAGVFTAIMDDLTRQESPEDRWAALDHLHADTGSSHAETVVSTMRTQFKEGGNLADRFETLRESLTAAIPDPDSWADEVDLPD